MTSLNTIVNNLIKEHEGGPIVIDLPEKKVDLSDVSDEQLQEEIRKRLSAMWNKPQL